MHLMCLETHFVLSLLKTLLWFGIKMTYIVLLHISWREKKLEIEKAALYHWLLYVRLWCGRTERTCLFHEELFALPVRFQGMIVISFHRNI